MPTCKVCGATSETVEFYAKPTTYCKEHWKEKVRQARENNIDHYRESDRQRAKLPHRIKAREKYRSTEDFARSHRKACQKYKDKSPERRSAQIAVGQIGRAHV